LKYSPPGNHGFPAEWPGPLTISGKKFLVDYSKLPYPISHYHELVPDEIKLEFELEHLQLSNNDSFTHNAFFSNRRATIAKSLVRIKNSKWTPLYSLKYLKTVDLASGDAGRDHWIFLKYKGENHLALACNEHLRALHQVGPQNQRTIQFVRMAKTHGFPLLATACKCDEMSKKPGMGPLTPIGRYFLTPMREMMARLRNELKEPVNLASYDYEIEEQWVLQAPAPPDEGKVGDDITVAGVSSLSSITSQQCDKCRGIPRLRSCNRVGGKTPRVHASQLGTIHRCTS